MEGKECGAKQGSHGWSVVPLFLDAGNLRKALPGRMKRNIFSCPDLAFDVGERDGLKERELVLTLGQSGSL